MWQRSNCLLLKVLTEQAYGVGAVMTGRAGVGARQYRTPFRYTALDNLLGRPNFENHKPSSHGKSMDRAAHPTEFYDGYLNPGFENRYCNSMAGRLMCCLRRSSKASSEAPAPTTIDSFSRRRYSDELAAPDGRRRTVRYSSQVRWPVL